MKNPTTVQYLFGGRTGWDTSDWVDSDDRVRGGQSQSYLRTTPESPDGSSSVATFSGHLDITTLGGAGFASQRTADNFPVQDISGSPSIVLDIAKTDGKRYTFVCKDDVQPKRQDGREQSTVSWEYDFKQEAGFQGKLEIKLQDFKPTYRGRPKPDAEPMDWSKVRRFSFLMRSFFGEQEGDFSISIRSVSFSEGDTATESVMTSQDGKSDREDLPFGKAGTERTWWKRLLCPL